MSELFSPTNLFKLGSGLVAATQQYKQGKDSKRAADRNADRLEAEGAEEKRRTRREQKKRQSSLRARAAASGIKISGSTKTFLDDYIDEDERQLSWLSESTSSKSSILRKQGKDAKRNSKLGAYGTFFQTAGNWLGNS